MQVVIDTISKEYRGQTGQPVVALQNIELTIREKEMVVLVGPSGCGKSTLLNIVGGLLSPTAGTVFLTD